MKTNFLQEKSYSFAVDIVKTTQEIQKNQKHFVLTNQLLRSGTSIGALLRECKFAESTADFIHKQSIALKEANESKYWISIMYEIGYISIEDYTRLDLNVTELIKLLVSSINTLKLKLKK
jgi:four helix bundle protein